MEKPITTELGTLALLNKGEIDMQIATAKQYPRDLKLFLGRAKDMATLTEEVAAECIYAIPRDGKTIKGPSARFAEIIISNWGNCRAGARIVDEGSEFVVSQGVFHDLESNTAITYEVRRRIVDKRGIKFKADMIGVTANAASSIAFRNAILKGVPKAIWGEIYTAVEHVIRGNSKTLAKRRHDAIVYLSKFEITEEMILNLLGFKNVEELGLEELVTLRGLASAIKNGDTTVEQAFSLNKSGQSDSSNADTLNNALNSIPSGPQVTVQYTPNAPIASDLMIVDDFFDGIPDESNIKPA